MSTAQGTHGILRFAAGGTPIHRETQLTDSADHGLPEPGPLLRNIDGPEELRALPIEKLPDLCHEVREYIWDTITRLGGHLAPSLGVVELSVVLHYLYDTPRDRLVWDVGHQGYVHKVLTGRRDALRTIRQYKGISGFLKREESPYDVFGAGHASTAISAGLGFATARDLAGLDHRVVAIVGDGAMTGGLAYEGLNNAGVSGRNFTVVLNDNSMSISPNVGAISSYLTKIISHPLFNRAKGEVWDLTGRLPKKDELRSAARRVEESVKTLFTPGMLFEDLGFRYLGPIDGHDIKGLISVFEKVRDMEGPILVHVLTRKGKGFDVSEADPNKYHGVKPKPPASGKVEKKAPGIAYTQAFGEAMVRLAEEDPRVVAITAAMADGTGLVGFAETHPDRFFDVGIAEAHGVTFASGLAADGMRPFCAIYSTFLQRAYDQIVHDVAVQHLPVVFCLDRAGVVGEDGPTHHGTLDLSYLGCVPGLVLAAPRNGTELVGLLRSALAHEGGPFAIRYPRDTIPEKTVPLDAPAIPVGSWEVLRPVAPVTLLAVGTMVPIAEQVGDLLAADGTEAGVVNARFVRPLDDAVMRSVVEPAGYVVTLEENSVCGGFGSQVLGWLEENGVTDRVRVVHFGLPDSFVEHAPRKKLFELVGLTPQQIHARLTAVLAGGTPASATLPTSRAIDPRG
ncbi:MAG: 1-deoxy-D-xylulose-5-phosphate synthase [Candidatus Eisenbacteria bacterium]|uniref:1-deoxy-D-xylulose-5-phosphate synthase n=1 Tax=Eiseniibacteriota bacterium TaxID=2212470 RepID=A0A956NBN9_UNCEI|nr:1-deoxy-D-xylulose-5-phosphate synthase [Candidatus Eisenbacteria bacterium]